MQRKELLQAVTATMVGVDKSGSPTGMDFLIFDKDWVRSFNDVLSVSFKLLTNIEGAVKAQELLKILNKMEGETLRVASEGEKFLIKDAHTTLQMVKMEEGGFTHLQQQIATLNTDNLEWLPIPDGFTDGLEVCLFSADTRTELTALAGVNFTENYITSTDNYRITLYTIQSPVTEAFTLPTEVATGLQKFGDELKEISIANSWVHFKDEGGLIVSVRKMLEDYPLKDIMDMLDNNFPESGKTKTYILPKNIENSIDRAEVLAGSGGEKATDFHALISLRRAGKNLVIKGEKEIGSVEDKVLWPDGKEFPENLELKVSPVFLKKIIKVSREFQLSPNNTTILFRGENFRHLMVAKVV